MLEGANYCKEPPDTFLNCLKVTHPQSCRTLGSRFPLPKARPRALFLCFVFKLLTVDAPPFRAGSRGHRPPVLPGPCSFPDLPESLAAAAHGARGAVRLAAAQVGRSVEGGMGTRKEGPGLPPPPAGCEASDALPEVCAFSGQCLGLFFFSFSPPL